MTTSIFESSARQTIAVQSCGMIVPFSDKNMLIKSWSKQLPRRTVGKTKSRSA